MTALSIPAPVLLKEARALAPIWLAAAVTMWASAAMGMLLIGLSAFALGAAALGAFSMGHEYTLRTLPTLLAQPLARSRLLLSKVLVLGALLVLLGLVASFVLLQADGIDRLLGAGESGLVLRRAIPFLLLALGLCVAPWLTIVCRSALAGMVFTLALPAAFWLAGQIARAALVGFDANPLSYSPGLTLMIAGVVAVSVIGAMRGGARFLSLEALDDSGGYASGTLAPAGGRPWWLGGGVRRMEGEDRSARRIAILGHPAAMLVRKEIRLQSLAFMVAGLYALSWIAMSLGRVDQYIAGQSFEALAGIYGGFLALLIGALASAEERALGTREWQTLQPYAFWKQWAIKLVTIAVLALVLGIGLAAALEWALPLIRDSAGGAWWSLPLFPRVFVLPGGFSGAEFTTIMILAVSLYVSTLSAGGLRALLVALPFLLVLSWLHLQTRVAANELEDLALTRLYGESTSQFPLWLQLRLSPTATPADFRWINLSFEWIGKAVTAGFPALTLVLASRNHRSAEHGTAVTLRQMTWVAAYVFIGGAVAGGLPRVISWYLLTH